MTWYEIALLAYWGAVIGWVVFCYAVGREGRREPPGPPGMPSKKTGPKRPQAPNVRR